MARLPAIALLVVFAALAVLLWPVLVLLNGAWTDKFGAHSHGYVVLALAVYFGWRILKASSSLQFKPSLSAANPLGVAAASAMLAQLLLVGPVQTVLLPIIVGLAVALCLGWRAAFSVMWPLLFLYLAMPAWGPVNPILQKVTVEVSTAVLGLTHIPFYVEGNFVHLGSGTFQIADGCSGLNYLIAALTIAGTQCTLHLSTTAARVKLMLAATLAGLLANWARVTSLIVIGHVTDMQHYLIRVEHFWFGWVLFMLMLTPVVLYGRWLSGREPEAAPRSPTLADWQLPLRWITVAFAVGAGGLIAAGAIFIGSLDRAPLDQISVFSGKVTSSPRFESGWRPHFVNGGGAATLMGSVGEVEVFHLAYALQTREGYVGHPENSVTGEHWQEGNRALVELRFAGQPVRVVEHQGQFEDEQRIIWELPMVGGRMAESRARRIAAMLSERLAGKTDAQVWALNAACRGDCDGARAQLRSVLGAD
jgi:exosortase